MGSRFIVVTGLASLLSGLAVSACKGESSDGDNGSGNKSSGGNSSGGASSGGSSSGTGPAGGASGNANGGRGGSSGAAMGGTSGDATGGNAGEGGEDSGGNPNGGMSGNSGVSGGAGAGTGGAGSGPGGSGGSGGAAGSGGASGGAGGAGNAGTAGSVGILGTPCSPRGALACAGNHQKLTVLCGGNDAWQQNLTCGAGEFCDSTPGPNVGLCRPEHPDCAEGPGTRFCADDEKNLVTCSPDAVSTSSVPCDGACHGGICRDDVGECPAWDDYTDSVACSGDCGRGNRTRTTCNVSCSGFVSVVVGEGAVLRTTWSDSTCTTCNGTAGYIAVNMSSVTGRVRVTVPAPWHVASIASCTTRDHCAIFNSGGGIYIVSTGLDDGPVNVLFEPVDSTSTCPP